ncbi:MAG: hypothetical protein Q9O62_03200 [Ardenticatenia bacterium]|nr:hypothetical protein [Ardenticatenia bacterium]
MEELQQRIEELMKKIPGYAGYAERENRRAADKELREAVAAAFQSQVDRLNRVQERLLTRGDFATLELLDKARTRLSHLAERLRTASYGYTGFFERARRLDLPELDRLYILDLELANGVERIGDLLAQMGLGERVGELAQRMLDELDRLHRVFEQRRHVIDTFDTEDAGRQEKTDPSGEEA